MPLDWADPRRAEAEVHEIATSPFPRRHAQGVRVALLLVVAALVLTAVPAAAGPAPPVPAPPVAVSAPAAAESGLPRWRGSVDLYRPGVFSTQKTWYWCTAADVQIMRNIVKGRSNHTRAQQQRYFRYMRTKDRYRIPLRDGVDPAGWAAGLRRFVHPSYRLVRKPSFKTTLRSAVRNLRLTGMPVGLTVARGNHAWVLTGFSATADPATSDRFTVTSVRVSGPLWGRQNSRFGYDMRPNTSLTRKQLKRFVTPWHYGPVRMAWEGEFVSVQPVPPRNAVVAATVPPPSESPAPLPQQEPFTLSVGESAPIEGGLSVHFAAVTEDSRCPADVVCVWEGNARVALELRVDEDAPASLELDTNPGFTTEATFGGYRLSLVGLEPYPLSETPMAEPYRATFVVTASTPDPGATATALLYSGVPDPDWSLTQADVDELSAIAAALESVEATPSEGGLGYRGFRVTGPQGTWRVNEELVLAPSSEPGTSLADPERRVERFLLESGLEELTEDEAGLIAEALEAAP